MKAVFKSDYTYKTGSTCPQGVEGCAPETINYKKGDVLGGLNLSLSADKKQVVSNIGNYTVEIPSEYLIIRNDDGTISSANLDSDSNQSTKLDSQSFLQKHKNHLLIIGAVVIGYFAYKKFNK
jgi:hypothetical protein